MTGVNGTRAELSPEGVATVDGSGLMADVTAQPAHLRDALSRFGGALPSLDAPSYMVVCGMGGSAIGADLARAITGDLARRPIFVHRDYAAPSCLRGSALAVCASYSGNTEETLSCYEAATDEGLARVVVTTGGRLGELASRDGVPRIELPAGLQPRAAVAYMLVAMLECARAAGSIEDPGADVEAAAQRLERLVGKWGPQASAGSLAKEMAGWLAGGVAVVHGAGETGPVARRWKGQINENAEAPAFWSELPEANHNELCSWDRAKQGGLAGVFLDSPGLTTALRRRLALTEDALAEAGIPSRRVVAEGDSPLERVLSLVLLGDLVSMYLAVLSGVDPTPVEPIERFKAALAG